MSEEILKQEAILRVKYQEVSMGLLFKTSSNRRQDQGLKTILVKLQITIDQIFNLAVVGLIFMKALN